MEFTEESAKDISAGRKSHVQGGSEVKMAIVLSGGLQKGLFVQCLNNGCISSFKPYSPCPHRLFGTRHFHSLSVFLRLVKTQKINLVKSDKS